MILEALLLLAVLVLMPALHLSVGWNIAVLIVVLVLVVPGVRLALRQSPPLVPTPPRTVARMMEMAQVKPGDHVVDLGCGDGRIVLAAARLGAQAVGYELSLLTLALAWWRVRREPRASVRYGDMFAQDYSKADVVCCYLLSSVMEKFHERIWPTLQPGCRVVSHTFRMKNVTPAAEEKDVVLYVR